MDPNDFARSADLIRDARAARAKAREAVKRAEAAVERARELQARLQTHERELMRVSK